MYKKKVRFKKNKKIKGVGVYKRVQTQLKNLLFYSLNIKNTYILVIQIDNLAIQWTKSN